MADFQIISTGAQAEGGILTPADTVIRHQASVAWLQAAIASSREPVVVVTHHGPSLLGCHPRYGRDLLTPAFLNDRPDLLSPPISAWVFGHTHHSGQWKVGGVDLVSNQRGYPQDPASFNPRAMIEVPSCLTI